MSVRSIRDIDIEEREFFRFDFNVPLDELGNIKDDTDPSGAAYDPVCDRAGSQIDSHLHLGRLR
jgi:3-phosphoglycerate kinase